MRLPCRYVTSTAAPTANAIRSAVPTKSRSASGTAKPRCRLRSIVAIGTASIRLAEFVRVLRNAPQIEIERDIDGRRVARHHLLVPRRRAIVPDHEIALAFRQIVEPEFSVGTGPR